MHHLLEATRNSQAGYGMAGPERAMLYRLAVETDLRSSELRSLTRSSFDLNQVEPAVTVASAYTKNEETTTIPLRKEFAAELLVSLANKMPSARAFNMPSKDRVIDMLRADLKSAGIAYRDESDRVVDFHALRHTCGSWLAAAGVYPKVIQRLVRHSTITLTMDGYTHPFKGDEAQAVSKLPDLSSPEEDAKTATGTDHADPRWGAQRGAKGGQNRQARWTNMDSNAASSCHSSAAQILVNTADLTDEQGPTRMMEHPAGVAELADATDSKSVGS